MEREKVIEWLDFCIRNTDGSICECEMSGCPYLGGSDVGNCFVTLMTDALALLKAQEPRVMTKGEYKALAEKPKEERDPVWEEWPGLESTWAIPEQAYGGYGTSWWAWTSRPTEEQMKAAK